jgi:hypothetical protein
MKRMGLFPALLVTLVGVSQQIPPLAIAKAPLFLIQAQNDYGLGPSEVLSPVIKRKGAPNQAKVYPPYGTNPQEGHAGFATKEGGIAIWGSDVLEFFRAAIR